MTAPTTTVQTAPTRVPTTEGRGLPVVVIGAGPVGLAAAAHLLERGLEPLVLEAGDQVGAAVRGWEHIRLFSPWRYDVDAAAARLLSPTGWQHPKMTGLPTGTDLVQAYLAPLAATAALAPRIRTGARVVAVSRVGLDKTHAAGRHEQPFLVRTRTRDDHGHLQVVDHHARAVIDASGTWEQRNPLGVSGLAALGEEQAAAVMAGPLPDVLGTDRARFAGRRTLVVGAGHSATNTLLHLVALADDDPADGPTTRIVWAVRGASVARTFGGGDLDGLPARGALGARLRRAVDDGRIELHTQVTIDEICTRPTTTTGSSGAGGSGGSGGSGEGEGGQEVVVVAGTPSGRRELVVDVIAAATGFRPDLGMLRELRLDLDPGVEAPSLLAPMIDPEFHSCGTVPPHGADVLAHPGEPGFFVAGMKSYGRAPTFLLATGYEQVRSIAAHLAGDAQAAAAVHLDLPETGVCSTAPPTVAADGTAEVDDNATGGSCCGTTAPTTAEPITIGIGAGVGARLGASTGVTAGGSRGFATGSAHGRSGELDDASDDASDDARDVSPATTSHGSSGSSSDGCC
ncbi:NAD(P)-binding domain-containing protein [Pseudokineococcus lusitanus]|uniref:Cation diffusion facilitator CzcD-associated flavoprotein CzcO n=1 Tax=Pseudokineococcus lusitanus TaxID=763993 RepID=A0A3N1HQA8_9ACTN|nr:NAD(P)-binding domain-containing protein [Pseudokineococcus lusitanus]ROP44687.1 cation diffusion facilitator CzcD-associated flavoprotein CzcO [Pseudokineococcus lusitanus]